MFAYLEGYAGGNQLEDTVKKYKKIYKSVGQPLMSRTFSKFSSVVL